jgi:hypothetical protein
MISQALVLGLETLFGLDIDENKEYELGQDFRAILERSPDVTNSIARYFEHYRMGDELVSGGALVDKAREESKAVDVIARELIDAMDPADFVAMPKSDLDRLVADMIAAGRLPSTVADVDIDVDDLQDRLIELQKGLS